MAHILVMGIATLDIINIVDHYPAEDEEMRAISQRISPGGNAVNTLRVLAQYGHRSHLAAVLADEADGKRLAQSLTEMGIDISSCQWLKGRTPCSYITLNAANGSRTIVHYRDLAELSDSALVSIPVEEYDWIHLEGRAIPHTRTILKRLNKRLSDQPISLEIEKDREGILSLVEYADLVIFSRTFVLSQGFTDPTKFLYHIRPQHPNRLLVCPWGSKGAWGFDAHTDNMLYAPGMSIAEVVDSVGAGDTFNAGLIHALVSGEDLQQALLHACKLAGAKVQQAGFEGLISRIANTHTSNHS